MYRLSEDREHQLSPVVEIVSTSAPNIVLITRRSLNSIHKTSFTAFFRNLVLIALGQGNGSNR
jgi:hypothetical protein